MQRLYAIPADKSVIVRAVILIAKANGDTQSSAPWLTAELTRVTTALISGATTIKSLAMAGLNGTGENEMRCDDLVEIFTLALETLTEEGVVGGGPLIPRIFHIPL